MRSETRRLHPLSPLFKIGSAAWKFLLPGLFVLLVASRGERFEIWAMVLFFPAVASALARYLSFRYTLGEDELVIREGILTRTERHVPYARIQNVDLVQNPLHRLLDVAEVRLETAGAEEPEASMQVLSLPAIEELRARVVGVRGGAPEPQPAPATPALLRLSLRDLALYGIISNRGMAIVVAVWGLAWQAGAQGWAPEWLDGWLAPGLFEGHKLQRWIVESGHRWASPYVTALRVLGGLVVLLVVLRVLSVIWAVVRLHGFSLGRGGDDLRTSYGLITRVSATVPRHRIQLLTVRETLLHRVFGRVEVLVDTAGGRQEDSGISHQLLVPLVARERLEALLREIHPELDPSRAEWRALDPRAWQRILARLLVVPVLVVAGAVYLVGPWAGAALPVVVPGAIALARRRQRRMAYALTPHAAFYRSGGWVRHLSGVRFTKIQALELSQGPLDRHQRMAVLRLDTAGAGHTGHRVRVPYVPVEVARELYGRLALEAASTEFRW
jgi:putative membrane protein